MLKLSTIMLVGVVCLSGCQAVKGTLAKRDNGSLDYVQATKLDPIRLPVHQETMPFVPLYDVPNTVGLSPITNESGKQYQLPKPPQIVK